MKQMRISESNFLQWIGGIVAEGDNFIIVNNFEILPYFAFKISYQFNNQR